MSKLKTFLKLLKSEPDRVFVAMADNMATSKFFHFIPDETYLRIQFRLRMGYKLDLKNPRSYSEKLQWLKLNYRNDNQTRCVDKYLVRDFVSNRIGDSYLIPLLGVWDSFDEIDFDKLPNEFVLKCNHDSNSIKICRDKSKFDKDSAKLFFDQKIRNSFYYCSREWPYKNVKPRIIAEKYMEDDKTKELRDYKFFCFNGEVKAMFIATDRQSPDKPTAFDFFDTSFNHLPIKQGHPNACNIPDKPSCFFKMLDLSRELSAGFPHVRIDFYEINGCVYFGEMTFYHFGGLMPFIPLEWDYKFGDWLSLPNT